MKRWLSHLTIIVYLAALSWGICSHTLRVGTGAHPVMYFLVWDMFCGWSAWNTKSHIIGEGASGKFYELAPPPWGELHPFGSLDRHDYDPSSIFSARLAVNCLKHTDHEPIVRVFVVEENWPKKFNLSDDLWALRYGGPKDIQRYYRVRHVLTGDGQLMQTYATWLEYQASVCVANNPRLRAETRKGAPLFALGAQQSHVNPYSAGPRFGFAPASPLPASGPTGRAHGN
ncbi:MAG TPA: hypothetical protein VML55_03515 [Planctomycetaceae bacterium]|nr:hypothetical protein [Planctomycetaceae bacterium]